MAKKKLSPLTEAILEMADDLRAGGGLNEQEHAKITKRHLGEAVIENAKPVTAEAIRALREREKISQAVLATFIGVTPGHISKLENAVATAEGSTLAMINVIRRKGLKAVA